MRIPADAALRCRTVSGTALL
jgi:hypothetical protein